MSKIGEATFIMDRGKEELLEVLKEGQERLGYLPVEFLVETAKSLGLSLSEVYGVATFYAFLSPQPQGRNVIRLCKSAPCFLKESHLLIDTIKRELRIRPGETTADGRFSIELTNCIGACDKAPAMLINHHVHGDLTPEKIAHILGEYQ